MPYKHSHNAYEKYVWVITRNRKFISGTVLQQVSYVLVSTSPLSGDK